ncbi:MAG: hypothetical protein CVV07_01990 [Gammaproteobacteria bacterium HGW-Gammaproteobacteria-11]|nr:MAG: hypothetical protein CVV07_01990 [Gammaproteobacteria bacterium HGW-Gammaproteobacteria-11]
MSTNDQVSPDTEEDIGSLRESLKHFVLPVEKTQRSRLIEQLDNELLSISDLTREILKVPAATLQICRVAGMAARKRDIDILTLEQACNLLGVLQLTQLVKDLPTASMDELPAEYRQLLSISEHAVSQAQGLFSQRMARLWHEVSLATLLFLAPYWVLVHQRPALFRQWERMQLGQQKDKKNHFNPWLSDSKRLLDAAQQLASDWWLPPWILQGYRSLDVDRRVIVKALHIARDVSHPQEQQARLDADRSLYRWLTQPANSLMLANGLALGAHLDWDAAHTGRWQQLTALYLSAPLDSVQSLTHQNAVEAARTQTAPEGIIWRPAQALLWPTGQRSRATRDRQTPSASTVAAPPIKPLKQLDAPALHPNQALWRQQCMKLLRQPNGFNSVSEMLQVTLSAMHDGLGIGQCWVALYNGREQQLVVSAVHGFEIGSSIVGLKLGPSRNTAWGRWLAGSPCHAMTTSSLRRESALIPGNLKRLLADQHALLLPVVHKGQIIALLAAQNLEPTALVSEQPRKALQKTAECLYRALSTFKQAPQTP